MGHRFAARAPDVGGDENREKPASDDPSAGMVAEAAKEAEGEDKRKVVPPRPLPRARGGDGIPTTGDTPWLDAQGTSDLTLFPDLQ